MDVLFLIIVFSLLGSAGVAAGAGTVLLVGDSAQRRLVSALVSYAVGTLLGGAFLGLLPTALQGADPDAVLATALAGIVGFFVLEKWVLWRHCHDPECDQHSTAGVMILVGDAFHNFVDGVAIAAAFLVSVRLGMATSLAVIAHEIPQELGDIAILRASGYSRGRSVAYNLLSSASTLPGALLAYYALSTLAGVTPYILAISAASFIYIAGADLIPGLHRHVSPRESLKQLVLMLAGIATILAVRALAH
jgi:zinc and cadmium transporter